MLLNAFGCKGLAYLKPTPITPKLHPKLSQLCPVIPILQVYRSLRANPTKRLKRWTPSNAEPGT